MSTKVGLLTAGLSILLCAAVAWGQQPAGTYSPTSLPPSPVPVESTGLPATAANGSAASFPAPVEAYDPGGPATVSAAREGATCCGPVGGNGPIQTELYLYTGPSLRGNVGPVSESLDTGWVVQGGGRSLFFNRYLDAAWTVDLGISYQFNHGIRPDITFPIGPNGERGFLRELHRAYLNLGLGQEYYLFKAANEEGWNWRLGMDGGGRLGTANIRLGEVNSAFGTSQNDFLAGVFVGFHNNVEIPCGCCIWLLGFRAEWDYIWGGHSRLPEGNILDVNLLGTVGVRY